MLNLVVSCKYKVSKTYEYEFNRQNYSSVVCANAFCIPEFEKMDRETRFELFKELKACDKKLKEDVMDYNNIEVSKAAGNQNISISAPVIETQILTDAEFAEFDKKDAYSGKKAPLKELDKTDNVEKTIYDAVGKSIDSTIYDVLKSPKQKDYPVRFAVWAEVHEEFKGAPKEAPKKSDDTRGYRTLGERFADSFEERDDLPETKEQTFGDID